nr:hypothetical protein CFP56_44573 [Quercus suber]
MWKHLMDYVDVSKDVGDIKVSNWVIGSAGPDGELRFLGFEDGLPLLMKWMRLKVWNLPSITLLDNGGHFAWKPYSYDVPDINITVCALSDAVQPLVHGTALEYWANKVERILVPGKHREGYATPSMKLYWKKVMSTFEGYVKSREVDEVVISPPLRELSLNAQLIPNTKAASAWAARQNLSFAEWRADLNGWVVHGGDILVEWSEKNIITKAPKSDLATNAYKRPRGKSPSSEDKPNKVTKSSAPADAPTSSLSPTKHYRRKTSPIDEDIETAAESPTAAGEAAIGESSEESAGKDLDVAITVGEAVAESWGESSSGVAKGMSLEEFLERFTEDEENEKVATNFHPLSNDTMIFQWSEIPVEGQPLLAAIMRKHPHFIAGCKLGASLRKSDIELLVAVLLDMQCTKLDSSNLQRVLEWKNALKDLLFMKFGVQFILDKIRAAAEACITRDDEFSGKIADLEREIATKRVELTLLLS